MAKIRITHRIFRFRAGKRIRVTVRPVNNIKNESEGATLKTLSGAYKRAKQFEEQYGFNSAVIEKLWINPNKIKK